MAAVAAPVTTADVAALHDRLTRFVYASFHRKLTFEEARDAAAEALGEADRAVAAGQRITNLNAWLCTAAWRNAISMVRRVEGEGRRKRLRPVDVSEQGEWLLDERDVEEEILMWHGRRTEHEALLAAWSRLKADEQRALYLRYFDELPVDEVLAILGCSRHHYENLTKRGLRKLRDALVAGVRDDGCRACRAAIVDARVSALSASAIAQRDAHLSACLPCKAFQRRQRGLIAALPLPGAGLLDRLAARFHALTASGGDPSHSGEVAAGTVALAGAGAGAGGAGAIGASGAAGGLLTVGGAAKTAAVLCSAGVTAGVCVGGAPFSKPKPREPRAAAAAARPAAKPQPAARPLAPVRTQTSAAAVPAATRRATSPPPEHHRTRAAMRAREEEAARNASSPFLPESAASPPPEDRGAASQSPRRPTTTFSSAGTPAPARTTSTSSTASARTAFSEEFTP